MAVLLISQRDQATWGRLKTWTSGRLKLRLLGLFAHWVTGFDPSCVKRRDCVAFFDRGLTFGRKYMHH